MADGRLQRTRDAYPRGTFTENTRARLPAMWSHLNDGSGPPRLTLDTPPPVSWRVRWFTVTTDPGTTWRQRWRNLVYLVRG